MRIPVLSGLIRRRILVNFRVDSAVMERLLPSPFRPKLLDGQAVAGICLIRLERVRPRFAPAFLSVSSENAAHRVAVRWEDGDGREQEGVYIPRRDTGSRLNHCVGGRLFPGEHHRARFDVVDKDGHIDFSMCSVDGTVSVRLRGCDAEALPESSRFASLSDASEFFRAGSKGYSATSDAGRLDGLELATEAWEVRPLEVEEVQSSYFDDPSRFPPGSVEFDCALLMCDIPHEWRSLPDLASAPCCVPAGVSAA